MPQKKSSKSVAKRGAAAKRPSRPKRADPTDVAVMRRRFRKCGIDAEMYETAASSLSRFLDICSSLISGDEAYWFRGHADPAWRLVPSALRFKAEEKRLAAIEGVRDVQRVLSYKMARPPALSEQLNWLQIAQHYGYPTRLLDWTQNPVVALYFACCGHQESDGLVAVMRPAELNAQVKPDDPRLFSYEQDRDLIDDYIALNAMEDKKRGKRTIAVVPSWDHERIFMQQGFFTLHGSRNFELDAKQASSLTYIPVPKEFKQSMIRELSRVGMGEMFVYPEPEHACSHLRWQKGLTGSE
jgi:hypothetical protein